MCTTERKKWFMYMLHFLVNTYKTKLLRDWLVCLLCLHYNTGNACHILQEELRTLVETEHKRIDGEKVTEEKTSPGGASSL